MIYGIFQSSDIKQPKFYILIFLRWCLHETRNEIYPK